MTAIAAPAAKKKSDLGVRAASGLVMMVVALGCLVFGGTPLWILFSIAGLLMLAEWCSLIAAPRWQTWVALALLAAPLFISEPHLDAPVMVSPAVLTAVLLLALVITQNAKLVAGMIYAGLPTLALFYLENQYDGIHLALWTLAIVWATDIGAYFAGRSIGGPKLAPVLSPNKTWAGLIGGICAAIIAGLVLAYVLHLPMRLPAFAGLLAVAAQGGDLYESAMKRKAGVKDSGRFLPGHGGAMDRLDGVVPVSCLVALIVATGVIG